MMYTIKEVEKIMGLPASTLRYYDKEGLLPSLRKNELGYRIFSEGDIIILRVIEHLKNLNMTIKEIQKYIEWMQMGDKSLNERYMMFLQQKKNVEEKMKEMQKTLDLINHKCWYYETAIAAGTEAIHLIDK